MAVSRKGVMGKVFGVSGATLLSRILGLLRVRFEAEVIGGGIVASAWYLAFSFPNLFRRLFGEGALGSALMPIVGELENECGHDHARGALGVIFPCLGLLLGVIVILCSLVALVISNCVELDYKWRLVCVLTPLLLPYAIFICLTGAMTAVANYARSFVKPAFYSLSMNIALVGGLLWGWYSKVNDSFESLEKFLALLSILFLISGAVQFILMCILLKRINFFPDFSCWKRHIGVLKKLWELALPSFISAGALQISFLIDRNLAFLVNDQGVAALTYIDRLIDLPIGLFAVAMGQVFMARMTSFAAEGNMEGLREDLNYGLRQVWFLAIPMGAGVVFFHEIMLKVICLGGSYTMEHLNAARSVAIFYGSGIPFFCAQKILQPAFYSRQDTKTPLNCSLTAICVNVVLSLALLKPLAHGGIALATAISAMLHSILLIVNLKKSGIDLDLRSLGAALGRALLAAVFAGTVVKFLLDRFYTGSGRAADFCALSVAGTLFLLIYAGCATLTGGRETRILLSRFRRKRS